MTDQAEFLKISFFHPTKFDNFRFSWYSNGRGENETVYMDFFAVRVFPVQKGPFFSLCRSFTALRSNYEAPRDGYAPSRGKSLDVSQKIILYLLNSALAEY